jgi:hypothetical protein
LNDKPMTMISATWCLSTGETTCTQRLKLSFLERLLLYFSLCLRVATVAPREAPGISERFVIGFSAESVA